jgi:uncharacterized SAM-binding protein YcdF (DUF218 family)
LKDRNDLGQGRQAGAVGFATGLVGSILVVGFLLGFGGFVSFVNLISKSNAPTTNRSADAIVVLTGGDDRLAEGMKLLADDKAARLLISGVNPEIDRGEIRKLVEPSAFVKFDCCVDLDKSALNTIGNAQETARWAQTHGYSTILVVTASYHMPRALLELQQQAPDLEVIAHPVFPADVHLDDWWRWPGSARLLISEYMKYLATQIRFRLKS